MAAERGELVARREASRLDEVRQNLGDNAYAQELGKTVGTTLVASGDREVAGSVADAVLKGLAPSVLVIEKNPALASRFVHGVLQALQHEGLIILVESKQS